MVVYLVDVDDDISIDVIFDNCYLFLLLGSELLKAIHSYSS